MATIDELFDGSDPLKVEKTDHPDIVGGVVWADCELDWIRAYGTRCYNHGNAKGLEAGKLLFDPKVGADKTALELEPCPFCGGSEKHPTKLRRYEAPWGRPTWAVECDNCGAHGGFEDTEAGARQAWNMRPNVDVTGAPRHEQE